MGSNSLLDNRHSSTFPYTCPRADIARLTVRRKYHHQKLVKNRLRFNIEQLILYDVRVHDR